MQPLGNIYCISQIFKKKPSQNMRFIANATNPEAISEEIIATKACEEP
jgi:hypothetical protein